MTTPTPRKNHDQRVDFDSQKLKLHKHEWRIDFDSQALKTHKHEWRIDINKYKPIMMMSSWGFTIAFTSLLFFYVGYRLDEWLGTAPNFMLGLFFLAIVTSIGMLFHEAWSKRKDV